MSSDKRRTVITHNAHAFRVSTNVSQSDYLLEQIKIAEEKWNMAFSFKVYNDLSFGFSIGLWTALSVTILRP